MSLPEPILAFATDYDRTLTGPDLEEVPAALRALRACRKSGVKIIVVSGRPFEWLRDRMADEADVLVAENGCIVWADGRDVEPRPPRAVFPDEVDFAIERGDVVVSVAREDAPRLQRLIDELAVDRVLVPNKDRVMALPPGVDKSAGVLAALRYLGIPPEACVAAGDGENDIALLEAVGYGIAVANAVPQLKDAADHVTAEPGGLGIAAWLRDQALRQEARA